MPLVTSVIPATTPAAAAAVADAAGEATAAAAATGTVGTASAPTTSCARPTARPPVSRAARNVRLFPTGVDVAFDTEHVPESSAAEVVPASALDVAVGQPASPPVSRGAGIGFATDSSAGVVRADSLVEDAPTAVEVASAAMAPARLSATPAEDGAVAPAAPSAAESTALLATTEVVSVTQLPTES